MYDKPVTVKASSSVGRDVEVRIGDQPVRWKALDIRIRPDERIEISIAVEPDEIDIATLQQNTRLVVEQRGDR